MRHKRAVHRIIPPDPVYNSVTLAKFTNIVMTRGKKSVAIRIVAGALDLIKERTKLEPIEVFDKAIRNVAPVLEVKSKRIGGANYQVPIEVRGDRKLALAFRWIIGAARSRKGKPMFERLADELIAASNKEGDAIKKREDVHRMADANRAFAHFA